MCGIAGMLAVGMIDLSPVFSMTSVQAHRGPDDAGHALFKAPGAPPLQTKRQEEGERLEGMLALGHRRLSIIARGDGGHQPMSYADGRYWITYNGEIYNYRELRDELRALGYSIVSESDTEVVLAAFSAWGNACFHRFNGMWALAIWDSRRRELTLSRDRFGVKPLHLRRHGNALFFASEIKGLLAGTSARARANPQTVHDFLVHGAANCDNDTFFDGITAFPPGCVATLKPDRDLTVEPEPYWRLDPTATREIPFAQACDEFRDLLTSSVRIRMRSDVPVGACLSGGLDSSSIVCLMDRDASGSAIHTFTARFPEPEFDESAWARCVIEATGVTGHFSMPTESGLLEDLDELIWHQEEPFSTASLYAQWLVMKQAREHDIPVLLDGQGADEILAGYRKFYAFHILALVRAHRIASAMGEFAALLRHGDRGYLRWREGARYLPAFMQRHVVSGRDFVTPELAHTTRTGHVALGASGDLRMRQMLDLTRYSVPSLLRYEDRNSMAWSIESRVPFLDYRLVEFALSLPVEHKLRGGRTKAVLRAGLRGIVPDRVLERRDKMGFVTPQSRWMEADLGRQVERACADAPALLRRWFGFDAMLRAWRTGSSRERRSMQALVFRAGILARWARRFEISAE